MSSQFNLQSLIRLSQIHQEKVREFIDLIFKASEELLDSIIDAVQKKIRTHSFFSLNSKTVKNLKQEIEIFEKKFIEESLEVEEDLKNKQIEITQMLQRFIEYLIEILNQTSSSYQNSIGELQILLDQIQNQLNKLPDELKNFDFLSKILIVIGILIGVGAANISLLAISASQSITMIGIPIAIGGVSLTIIGSEILFVKKLNDLDRDLNEQKYLMLQKKQNAFHQIKQILDKAIEIFLKNCQTIKEKAIVWYDKDIMNIENSALCKRIQDHFQEIKKFHFTNDLKTLTSYLDDYYITYLILQGSICETFMEQINDHQNIHSVIIYCFNINKYKGLMKQYHLIKHIVNKQDELIKALEKQTQSSVRIFGQINFYYLPNYFHINPLIDYFSTLFQISRLEEINEIQALEILQNTLKNVPQNQFSLVKVSKMIQQIQQYIQDIIKLYTLKSNFHILINKTIQSLNECAILESKLLIQSLNFSLENYDDRINYQIFFRKQFRLKRGIQYSIELFKMAYKIGDLIVFPAFTSTTESLAVASDFAGETGLIFQIQFNEKSWDYSEFKKSRPKSIKNISNYSGEKEYLFPCFSCFIIKEFLNNTVELEYIKI